VLRASSAPLPSGPVSCWSESVVSYLYDIMLGLCLACSFTAFKLRSARRTGVSLL
jgi:hypothetical protein